jgi:hypothetical protein
MPDGAIADQISHRRYALQVATFHKVSSNKHLPNVSRSPSLNQKVGTRRLKTRRKNEERTRAVEEAQAGSVEHETGMRRQVKQEQFSLAGSAASRATLEAPLTSNVSPVRPELVPSTPIVSRSPASSCKTRAATTTVRSQPWIVWPPRLRAQFR